MTGPIPVRVMVQDVWDEILLEVVPGTAVRTLKRVALERAGVTKPVDEFVAKFRGALLDDEDRSIADVGLVPNAAVVVVPRRRRPVL